MSKNAHIWREWGIKPEAWAACDAAMPAMMEIVRTVPHTLAGVVLAEARTQVEDLPHRAKEYREARTWRPDDETDGGEA